MDAVACLDQAAGQGAATVALSATLGSLACYMSVVNIGSMVLDFNIFEPAKS